MKTKSIAIILLAAATAHGQAVVFRFVDGYYVIEGRALVKARFVDLTNDDLPPIPRGDDDDDDDDTIGQRVAAWADDVGEPGPRTVLGVTYRNVAESMAEWPPTRTLQNGTTQTKWQRAMAGIAGARPVAILGSAKLAEWNQLFAKVDVALESAPHVAASLLAVAQGFERGSLAPAELQELSGVSEINWLALIQCVPCIVGAFTK